MTHADKLKACRGPTPPSWLTEPAITPQTTPARGDGQIEHDVANSSDEELGLLELIPESESGTPPAGSPPPSPVAVDPLSPVMETQSADHFPTRPTTDEEERHLRDRRQMKKPIRYRE